MQAIDPISKTCYRTVAVCVRVSFLPNCHSPRQRQQLFGIYFSAPDRARAHTIKRSRTDADVKLPELSTSPSSRPPVSFYPHLFVYLSILRRFSNFIHFDCILLRLFHFGIFVFISFSLSLDENKYECEIHMHRVTADAHDAAVAAAAAARVGFSRLLNTITHSVYWLYIPIRGDTYYVILCETSTELRILWEK